MINSQNFYFITNTDTQMRVINVGQFTTTVIIDKVTPPTPPDPEKYEIRTLYNLKKGKDDCLIELVEAVKAAGGNGVLDLEIQYGLIGLGGDRYQVSTHGTGVYLS